MSVCDEESWKIKEEWQYFQSKCHIWNCTQLLTTPNHNLINFPPSYSQKATGRLTSPASQKLEDWRHTRVTPRGNHVRHSCWPGTTVVAVFWNFWKKKRAIWLVVREKQQQAANCALCVREEKTFSAQLQVLHQL